MCSCLDVDCLLSHSRVCTRPPQTLDKVLSGDLTDHAVGGGRGQACKVGAKWVQNQSWAVMGQHWAPVFLFRETVTKNKSQKN